MQKKKKGVLKKIFDKFTTFAKYLIKPFQKPQNLNQSFSVFPQDSLNNSMSTTISTPQKLYSKDDMELQNFRKHSQGSILMRCSENKKEIHQIEDKTIEDKTIEDKTIEEKEESKLDICIINNVQEEEEQEQEGEMILKCSPFDDKIQPILQNEQNSNDDFDEQDNLEAKNLIKFLEDQEDQDNPIETADSSTILMEQKFNSSLMIESTSSQISSRRGGKLNRSRSRQSRGIRSSYSEFGKQWNKIKKKLTASKLQIFLPILERCTRPKKKKKISPSKSKGANRKKSPLNFSKRQISKLLFKDTQNQKN